MLVRGHKSMSSREDHANLTIVEGKKVINQRGKLPLVPCLDVVVERRSILKESRVQNEVCLIRAEARHIDRDAHEDQIGLAELERVRTGQVAPGVVGSVQKIPVVGDSHEDTIWLILPHAPIGPTVASQDGTNKAVERLARERVVWAAGENLTL